MQCVRTADKDETALAVDKDETALAVLSLVATGTR